MQLVQSGLSAAVQSMPQAQEQWAMLTGVLYVYTCLSYGISFSQTWIKRSPELWTNWASVWGVSVLAKGSCETFTRLQVTIGWNMAIWRPRNRWLLITELQVQMFEQNVFAIWSADNTYVVYWRFSYVASLTEAMCANSWAKDATVHKEHAGLLFLHEVAKCVWKTMSIFFHILWDVQRRIWWDKNLPKGVYFGSNCTCTLYVPSTRVRVSTGTRELK